MVQIAKKDLIPALVRDGCSLCYDAAEGHWVEAKLFSPGVITYKPRAEEWRVKYGHHRCHVSTQQPVS